ncbi:MAG: alanyl-tRNA synthetase [Candidatus Midichloriaceae bacterium]|jgi:alanyl-tRNA synthetase
MKLNDIRSSFLDYFKKLDHKILPSSGLIPHNDPSLLFTNAGMVQFKNSFIGLETPLYPRISTSQKCIRAGGKHNDLENVGYTTRHHTFFEMLGNFSFGDYFKEEAIVYAWNYLIKELGVSEEKLYITVYHEDDEAYKFWKKLTGFSDSKIIKIKTNDNFWSMGEFGPCGPCSEIFYDHGEKYEGGLPGTKEQDGDRFVEIWNLVFMQFETLTNGKRKNLPKPCIDTGMGLERISAVMQGTNDNYDTDLFKILIQASQDITSNKEDLVSHKVIADHLRSACFLISDGILPSNEGRGYVLRRIIRRAIRHVHNIGYKDLLLYKLAPIFIGEMRESYPELNEAKELINSVLEMEEGKFKETINTGMKYLLEELNDVSSGSIFDGKKAFKLYDTYGFPLDLTENILKEKNISLDKKGYESEMQQQKVRARAAWSGSGEEASSEIWHAMNDKFGATEFIREEHTSFKGKILAIVNKNNLQTTAEINDEVIIVTDQTTFYAESGGQIGDMGKINGNDVYDTKKFIGKIHGHLVKVTEELKVGDEVDLKVDFQRRKKIKANHSATHLLQYCLRSILGKHVIQKGSLVNDEKLRFDFTNNKSLTSEEVKKIECMMNKLIIDNNSINCKIMSINDAKDSGAMALFGEKYDEEVRVVSMGDSIELCGGTHVSQSGDIGNFIIISEESISSGIRRIEAITGQKAVEYSRSKIDILNESSKLLKIKDENLLQTIKDFQINNKEFLKKIEDYEIKNLIRKINEEKLKTGVTILSLRINEEKQLNLKKIYDYIKKLHSDTIVVLMNTDVKNSRFSLLVSIPKQLIDKYSAKDIVTNAFELIGGKGGGNKEIAQASGININKEQEVYELIKGCIF